MTIKSATTTARTLRFAAHNLLRLRRNFTPIFFSTILPVLFYLLFGAMMDFGDTPFKEGNSVSYTHLTLPTILLV